MYGMCMCMCLWNVYVQCTFPSSTPKPNHTATHCLLSWPICRQHSVVWGKNFLPSVITQTTTHMYIKEAK